MQRHVSRENCMNSRVKEYWQTKMSESKFTGNIVVVLVEGLIALLSACAMAYAAVLNSEIDRLNDQLTKTEARLTEEIARVRSNVNTVAADQKLTIEKLHAEYCGIQRSLADINVAVTALNSKLISRESVEKIARREATLYHQACEASKRQDKK